MEWPPPRPSQQPVDLPVPTKLSYGAATQPSEEGHQKKSGNPAWLIGVMLVSLAAVLAVVLLTRGRDDQSSPDTSAAGSTSVAQTVAETKPPTTASRVTTPPPTIALIVETTVPPETTVLAETTTTTDPAAPVTTVLGATTGALATDLNFVVAAPDGTHLVSSGGELNVLPKASAVSYQTIDGGLVYQERSGRGDSEEATHIRRVVGGAEAVIVVAEGEFLRLHDVSRGDGNDILVLYSKLDGTTPEDSEEGLYLLDLLSGTTSSIGVIGGWENGTSMLDLASDVIVGEASAEVSTSPFALDRRGNPVDISTPVGLAGNYVDCAECPHHFSIDPTGTTMAWGENGTLVIAERSGATPPLRVPIPGFVDGFGIELSVRSGVVLINREGATSLVVDTRSGTAQVAELPMIGFASFAS